MTLQTNLRAIGALLDRLATHGVTRNTDADKAITVAAHAQRAATDFTMAIDGPARDLAPEQVRSLLVTHAVASMPGQISAGIEMLHGILTREVLDVLRADAPRIINELRPEFDAAAEGVYAAVKAGVQAGMTTDNVIDLTPAAIAAWRALPGYLSRLDNIAAVRIEMTRVLGIPPLIDRGAELMGERIDYTACFTHPDSNVTAGYAEGRPHRWLSLATATNCRLRLNDPDETQLILYGEGESPGWTVTAHAAIVYDADGRALHLYQGAWVPRWVDQAQLDRLIDKQIVSAARHDKVRGDGDAYPLGGTAVSAGAGK